MAFAAVGGALVSGAIGGTWGAVAGAATSALIGSATGGSGGGTTSANTSTTTRRSYDPFESRANDAATSITRGTWDYAKQFYHPLEDELIAKSSAVDEDQVNKRGDIAQRAGEATYQGYLRDLQRQGTTMSGQQKAYLDRKRQLGLSAGRAFAQNSDRLTQLDRNRNVVAALTGFGRSSLSQADAAANAAAGMETQRNVSGGYTDTSTATQTTTQKAKSGGSI